MATDELSGQRKKKHKDIWDSSEENRFVSLIKECITDYKLKLDGLNVLTEAASGNYASTALASALAGAEKVIAITKSSHYGLAKEVKRKITRYSSELGVDDKIKFVSNKRKIDVANSDIITNLGFVRPIDTLTIKWMKPTAVIPLMYESWEFRELDIDVETSAKRGIPVIGVNEGRRGADTFKFCGTLAIKLILETGLECCDNHIAVVSKDQFGRVILQVLRKNGANTILLPNLNSKQSRKVLCKCDALVLADYSSELLIGQGGQISWNVLRHLAPGITVVQICGVARCDENSEGITCYPNRELEPYHMSHTLSYLGPKPVINLNIAGLKVGELATRALQAKLSPEEAIQITIKSGFGQKIPKWFQYWNQNKDR